jgi:hypothetical protein
MTMKKEYDFSHAIRGKFYRPASQLRVPVYLDEDVAVRLRQRRGRAGRADVSALVNDILRKELEVVDALS